MTETNAAELQAAKREALPEYYVLLCAQRYAVLAKKFRLAGTENERCQLRNRLNFILEAGRLEANCERDRRAELLSQQIRKSLAEKQASVVSVRLSSEESEMLRYAVSVPPMTSLSDLSADEMSGLADMFEGWAQSAGIDSVSVARVLGWADGFRDLVDTVGSDYVPTAATAGVRPSLLKFMAAKMRIT
jgi:hypothetical protein